MRDLYFPFQALGFRCNPFRALDDAEWAAVAVMPPAVAAAAASGDHLQILGAMGRGKTTALLALAARLRTARQRTAYEYLAEGQTRLTTDVAAVEVFLLDEAQRLSTRERGRLLSAAVGGLRLMVSSHSDLGPQFARRGLALATVRLGATEPGTLAAVLERRLAYFALDPAQPGVKLEPEAVDVLHARYGSDLRAIERLLYEVFQGLEQPGPLTARVVAAAIRRAER